MVFLDDASRFNGGLLAELAFESLPQFFIGVFDAILHALQYKNDATLRSSSFTKSWFLKRLVTPWFLLTAISSILIVTKEIWPFGYWIIAFAKRDGCFSGCVRKGIAKVATRRVYTRHADDDYSIVGYFKKFRKTIATCFCCTTSGTTPNPSDELAVTESESRRESHPSPKPRILTACKATSQNKIHPTPCNFEYKRGGSC